VCANTVSVYQVLILVQIDRSNREAGSVRPK
jgi:hypothetical protein